MALNAGIMADLERRGADPATAAWNQVKEKFSGLENPRGAAVTAELEKHAAIRGIFTPWYFHKAP